MKSAVSSIDRLDISRFRNAAGIDAGMACVTLGGLYNSKIRLSTVRLRRGAGVAAGERNFERLFCTINPARATTYFKHAATI